MAHDITHIVEGLNARKVFLGITFEQMILILYPLFLIPTIFFWYKDLRKRKFSPQVPAGCVRLGTEGKSNLADEADQKYDSGTSDTSAWKVKGLFVYPIKSCAAIELDVADVHAQGLVHDRLFAFAELLTSTKPGTQEETSLWTFRTLRQPGYEKLAHVRTEVWVPKPTNDSNPAALRRVEREGCLIVRYPNVPVGALAWLDRLMLKWSLVPKEKCFTLPLNPGPDHTYPLETIKVFSDAPTWLNMGKHVPSDFGEWLGVTRPLSIFRSDPASYRTVSGPAPRKEDVGFEPAINFQDSFPLQLLNIASVHKLGHDVGKAVIANLSVRRFRPNILVEGPPAYDEDGWKRCRIGGNDIICSCPTTRCKLPNVDPVTAVRNPVEPDKTLRATRRIDPSNPHDGCLGLQMVPGSSEPFTLRVGDRVDVLRRD